MHPSDVKKVVDDLRQSFEDGFLSDIEQRKNAILAIIRMLDDNEADIVKCGYEDLHRGRLETVSLEISITKLEAHMILSSLDTFLADESLPKSVLTILDTTYIQRQPLGVVLVIGPWNVVLYTSIMPLIGAIAAGNMVLLKPSEYAPHTASLLADLIPKYLDKAICRVICGDAEMTKNLLKTERFDFICFTGGTGVGRQVYKAAAEYLTPVLLELGGKNPAYVHHDTLLPMTGRRICWGRYYNAGQICLSPDYVICHKDVQDELVKSLVTALIDFYGENPRESADYGRIVTEKHFERITNLLRKSKGTIVHGGETDEKQRYIAPTIVTDVSLDDSLMSEEIFGPILPIINVNSPQEAISFIRSRPKPLAAYVFTQDDDIFKLFKERTSSGSLCRNTCCSQGSALGMPFGGVGDSGIGRLHGKYSIDAFSHLRSIYWKHNSDFPEKMSIYPPHTVDKESRLKWVIAKSTTNLSCSLM